MACHGVRLIAVVLGLGTFVDLVQGGEPPPAVSVRLLRPDVQCERVLALFQGARAPHPAAALAAWKRSGGNRRALNKTWEAAITAFNPEMAGELRGLDQAELVVWFDPENGAPHWYATLPHDDGSFANLATALALTDGSSEPPLGTVALDRLGPGPGPLVARAPDRLALGDSRGALRRALVSALDWKGGTEVPACESGWLIRLDPESLGRTGSIGARRLAEALRGLRCRSASAAAALEGETLAMALTLRLDAPPPSASAIDPAWLEDLPERGLVAAFACAIDPSAVAWDQVFAVADRVERADPAKAGVAPLRTRINLVAATVKVRPELDLWPRLRGLSGALLVDPTGAIDGAVLSLHTDSLESAERIRGHVLPALAPLLGLRNSGVGTEVHPPAEAGRFRLLGRLHHRTVSLEHHGTTVRLIWGESALAAVDGKPAGLALRQLVPPAERTPQRFAAFWPGRLALASTLGAPLAATLAEAPPVVWSGRNEAPGAREIVRWTGLRDLVHHFLDRLPLDPPPSD